MSETRCPHCGYSRSSDFNTACDNQSCKSQNFLGGYVYAHEIKAAWIAIGIVGGVVLIAIAFGVLLLSSII